MKLGGSAKDVKESLKPTKHADFIQLQKFSLSC